MQSNGCNFNSPFPAAISAESYSYSQKTGSFNKGDSLNSLSTQKAGGVGVAVGDGMDDLREAISQLKERLAHEETERNKLEEKIKREMSDKERAITQELQGLKPKAPIISSKEAMQLRNENDNLKKKLELASSDFTEAFNQKKEELMQVICTPLCV